MFKKIIYIHFAEFYDYDSKRFGIKFFLKKKIKIENWDVTKIFTKLRLEKRGIINI